MNIGVDISRVGKQLRNYIFWEIIPGSEITVRWPSGVILAGGMYSGMYSADPNDHYRSWMEQNVGKQGIDWDWKIHLNSDFFTPGYEDQDVAQTQLIIKFRKGKDKYASMAKLLWT